MSKPHNLHDLIRLHTSLRFYMKLFAVRPSASHETIPTWCRSSLRSSTSPSQRLRKFVESETRILLAPFRSCLSVLKVSSSMPYPAASGARAATLAFVGIFKKGVLLWAMRARLRFDIECRRYASRSVALLYDYVDAQASRSITLCYRKQDATSSRTECGNGNLST